MDAKELKRILEKLDIDRQNHYKRIENIEDLVSTGIISERKGYQYKYRADNYMLDLYDNYIREIHEKIDPDGAIPFV